MGQEQAIGKDGQTLRLTIDSGEVMIGLLRQMANDLQRLADLKGLLDRELFSAKEREEEAGRRLALARDEKQRLEADLRKLEEQNVLLQSVVAKEEEARRQIASLQEELKAYEWLKGPVDAWAETCNALRDLLNGLGESGQWYTDEVDVAVLHKLMGIHFTIGDDGRTLDSSQEEIMRGVDSYFFEHLNRDDMLGVLEKARQLYFGHFNELCGNRVEFRWPKHGERYNPEEHRLAKSDSGYESIRVARECALYSNGERVRMAVVETLAPK